MENKTTPQCKICDEQHELAEFDSSAWVQFHLREDHPDLLWICPSCQEIIGLKQNLDSLIRLRKACAEIVGQGKIDY